MKKQQYWKSRTNTERSLRDKNIDLPFEPSYNPKKAGGIFRGLTIDIRPQGNVGANLRVAMFKNTTTQACLSEQGRKAVLILI
ncbi:MAG: hypothetical protein R2777_02050 [Chitinophagales bacterium]